MVEFCAGNAASPRRRGGDVCTVISSDPQAVPTFPARLNRMESFAGTDRPQRELRRSATGSGGRVARARDIRMEPERFSVHRVGPDGESCDGVDVELLERLEKPWSEWPSVYRCRVCSASHPSD